MPICHSLTLPCYRYFLIPVSVTLSLPLYFSLFFSFFHSVSLSSGSLTSHRSVSDRLLLSCHVFFLSVSFSIKTFSHLFVVLFSFGVRWRRVRRKRTSPKRRWIQWMSSTSSLRSQRRPPSPIWVRRRAKFRGGPRPSQPPFIFSFFFWCCSLPSAGARNQCHSRSYAHLHVIYTYICTHPSQNNHSHPLKDLKTFYWGMQRMQNEMRWRWNVEKRTEDRKVLPYPLLSFPFPLFLILAERAVCSWPIAACPPGSRSLNLILC